MPKPTSKYGLLIGLLISAIFWAILYFLKFLYPETFQINSVQWTAVVYTIGAFCIAYSLFFSSLIAFFMQDDDQPYWTAAGMAGWVLFAPMGFFLLSCLKNDIFFRFDSVVIAYLIAILGATIFGGMIGHTSTKK